MSIRLNLIEQMPTEPITDPLELQLRAATDAAQQGQYGDALRLLKHLLDAFPQHELALGMLAAIYMQIGLYQKAENLYRKLLKLNPDNSLAKLQRALALLQLDRNAAVQLMSEQANPDLATHPLYIELLRLLSQHNNSSTRTKHPQTQVDDI